MNEDLHKLLDKAQYLGWSVEQECENVYDFGKGSNAGQDFHVTVDTENDADLFLYNLYERYSNFDVSHEAYMWLDDEGHGVNGAPYDMKDLYEDMEQCQEMILDLFDELNEYHQSM